MSCICNLQFLSMPIRAIGSNQNHNTKMSYLGGIDFMLLSGSSNTLGQASGVTEM